ncbi:MAG: TRAP transporter substrate-binding protein [Proteobacteria bacterium]|nr:TRAP transporter substrate-binding protein [Pseudomonadota bacterium]
MKVSSFAYVAAVGLAGALLCTPAGAQQLPKTHLKIIGQPTILFHYPLTEVPFFEQELPKMSGGAITVDLIPYDRVGIKGPEVLRLMKTGAFDWATNSMTYLVGDSPKFEGCDLAGLTDDIDTARKACEVYKPVLNALMEKDWNIKLLALAPYPPQAIWCRSAIGGLADLKGKKVRVFNSTMTDFVEALGATSTNIPFVDVIPALQRGVTDCGVTGTLSGNTAKWYEVTTHIFPVGLGWAINFFAVNVKAWDRLDPKVREFLTGAFKKLEDKYWEVGRKSTEEGVSCNTGGACTMGTKANLTLVKFSEADKALRKKVMQERVIPNWAKRCGSACAKEWNETVGKVVGLQAPTNF